MFSLKSMTKLEDLTVYEEGLPNIRGNAQIYLHI
jgi:hypothetical protein